jgi:MbtH protein
VTEENETRLFRVVVNQEEQYSIWPADKPLPNGWSPTGTEGSKQSCLEYIREVWTDMRPASVRQRLETVGRQAKNRGEHS